jgi:DNA (cytosine-5)-methyltransferase 1
MRCLDLFCGAGGASMGYHRAGFEIVGVDIKPQPHYPFEFHQADALEYLAEHGSEFDFIHASPPCQLFTIAGNLRNAQGKKTLAINLIPQTRELLIKSGRPYAIENVPGSPLKTPIILCGSSFGLKVRRHRLFEIYGFDIAVLDCQHKKQGRPIGIYYVMGDNIPGGGRTARNIEEGRKAMGIEWMVWDELKEAIPPVYTEFIGKQILEQIKSLAEKEMMR